MKISNICSIFWAKYGKIDLGGRNINGNIDLENQDTRKQLLMLIYSHIEDKRRVLRQANIVGNEKRKQKVTVELEQLVRVYWKIKSSL